MDLVASPLVLMVAVGRRSSVGRRVVVIAWVVRTGWRDLEGYECWDLIRDMV